jgi:hypothetical protein
VLAFCKTLKHMLHEMYYAQTKIVN